MLKFTKANITTLSTEAFWVLAGQFLGVVGSIIGVRILTTLMEPEDYGVLAILVSFATVAQYLPGLALSDTAMRYYSIATAESCLHEYKRLFISAFGVFASALWFIALVVFVLVWFFKSENSGLVIPAGVFALASVGYLLLVGMLSGARARKAVAVVQSLFQLARFFLACILVWLFSASVLMAMWGFAIGACVVAIIGYYILVVRVIPGKGRCGGECPGLAGMMGYGWPLLVTGILTWVSLFIDRWSLGMFATAEDIGRYFALYQVGYFPALVGAQTLRQYVSPLMFHGLSRVKTEDESEQIYRLNFYVAHIILGMFVAVFLLCLFTHEAFFSVLVGESYRSVSGLWPYLVLAGGLSVSSSGLLVSMFSGQRTRAMIPMKLITTGVIASCVIIGGSLYGIRGVVMGMLVFTLVEFVITELFVLNTARKKYR